MVKNSMAMYTCSSGYKLVGNILRQCRNGTWSGAEPQCKSKACKMSYNHINMSLLEFKYFPGVCKGEVYVMVKTMDMREYLYLGRGWFY